MIAILLNHNCYGSEIVDDQAKVGELLSKANSSLGYIKMITPKKFNDGQSGFTKIGMKLILVLY